MKGSLRRKGNHLHHPGGMFAGSIIRGRHLDTRCISDSRKWMANQYQLLSRRNPETLSGVERSLLRNLTGTLKGGA